MGELSAMYDLNHRLLAPHQSETGIDLAWPLFPLDGSQKYSGLVRIARRHL